MSFCTFFAAVDFPEDVTICTDVYFTCPGFCVWKKSFGCSSPAGRNRLLRWQLESRQAMVEVGALVVLLSVPTHIYLTQSDFRKLLEWLGVFVERAGSVMKEARVEEMFFFAKPGEGRLRTSGNEAFSKDSLNTTVFFARRSLVKAKHFATPGRDAESPCEELQVLQSLSLSD